MREKLKFVKMHGIGNDYIYFDCMEGEIADPAGVARAMSPRRFSVGGDGIVMVCASRIADCKMRMFNADGSEGKMCGNAIRCVGKFVYDRGIVGKTEIDVETLSGIKHLSLETEYGRATMITADIGRASFAASSVPVLPEASDAFGECVDYPVTVDGREWHLTALSTGNPHAVIFCDDVESLNLERIGPLFEHHRLFPDRVNTEFVTPDGNGRLRMRVWERGSGETWACGTGASASVAAAVKTGRMKPSQSVTVRLNGGEIQIKCSPDYGLVMRGPAATVYEGEYEYEY